MYTPLIAAEAGSSNLALVLPDWSELIAGVIAFAIVFFFIWKWALPAINKMLEGRQQAIVGKLEEAESAKTEAQSLLDDYRAQLNEARAKSNEIIEEARRAAEALRTEVTGRANTEAEQIVAKAREEAASEHARLLAETRREVANLSIDLAEKVVGQALDRETQLGLVERYITELEHE